ncbi:MAG: helix-turn-helix domain-containing protein [Planctomycetota bacterium]
MENDSKRPSGASRLIAILDAVALAGGHLRYRDASRVLAPVSPNTVARLLHELVTARVLEQDAKGYHLGDRPIFWAVSASPKNDLRLLARPALVQLTTSLKLTSCLIACMDGHMTIVDRIVAPTGPLLMPPGQFRPPNGAHIGGPFFMTAADLQDPKRWAASLASATVGTDPEIMRRLTLQGLTRDFLDDDGLIYRGVRRLVTPIRRGGRIVACLGLGGRPRRLADPVLRRHAARMLRAAARQISQQLTN